MNQNDYDYFARRERQERDNAGRARDSGARQLHLELADRYSQMMREARHEPISAGFASAS